MVRLGAGSWLTGDAYLGEPMKKKWIQRNYGENFIHVVLEQLFYLFWEVLSVYV